MHVLPHHLTGEVALIGKRDLDLSRVFHDVGVGQHIATARVDDHSRAFPLLRHRRALVAEELTEELWNIRARAHHARIDTDHRRANAPHRFGDGAGIRGTRQRCRGFDRQWRGHVGLLLLLVEHRNHQHAAQERPEQGRQKIAKSGAAFVLYH